MNQDEWIDWKPVFNVRDEVKYRIETNINDSTHFQIADSSIMSKNIMLSQEFLVNISRVIESKGEEAIVDLLKEKYPEDFL